MRSLPGVLKLLAVFFIVLGTVWFSFIQSRCYEIARARALSAAELVSGMGDAVQLPGMKIVRSPHANFYHDLFFHAITVIELFTSIFYILAGMFLLRRYVLTRICVSLALWSHVFLVILVMGFMKFGAIPLSQLTRNPNMLELYFLPSHKIHNLFLVAFNGFDFYLPGGTAYFFGMVLYFYACFYVFSYPDVKADLTPAKNV